MCEQIAEHVVSGVHVISAPAKHNAAISSQSDSAGIQLLAGGDTANWTAYLWTPQLHVESMCICWFLVHVWV